MAVGVHYSNQVQSTNWRQQRFLSLALNLFFEMLLARRIRVLTIVIDNTSVRDTMVRGSSRPEIMNQFIVASIEILKSLGCRVIIRYIPSDLNPSDAISRGAIPE